MEYARLTKDFVEMARASGKEDKEEVTKDEDMADKTNVCTSHPHYQEMLSYMTEKARRDMKKRMEEDSAAIREEVSIVAESNKKNDEEHERMKQQSSTSLAKAARRTPKPKGTWGRNPPHCFQTKEVKTKRKLRPTNSWELNNPR